MYLPSKYYYWSIPKLSEIEKRDLFNCQNNKTCVKNRMDFKHLQKNEPAPGFEPTIFVIAIHFP